MEKITQLGRFLLDNKLEARMGGQRGKVHVTLIDERGDCHKGEANSLQDALSDALARWATAYERGMLT